MTKINMESFSTYLACSISPSRHNVIIHADKDLQEQVITKFIGKSAINDEFSFKFVELDGLEIIKDSMKLESGLQKYYEDDNKRKPIEEDIEYYEKRNIDLANLSQEQLRLLKEKLWEFEKIRSKETYYCSMKYSFFEEYLANLIYVKMTNIYSDTLKEQNSHNDVLQSLKAMRNGNIGGLLDAAINKGPQFFNFVSLIDYMKSISLNDRKRIVAVIKNADYILDFEMQCVINGTMANQRSCYLNMNYFCETTPYHMIVDDRFHLEEGHDIQTHNVRLKKEFYQER